MKCPRIHGTRHLIAGFCRTSSVHKFLNWIAFQMMMNTSSQYKYFINLCWRSLASGDTHGKGPKSHLKAIRTKFETRERLRALQEDEFMNCGYTSFAFKTFDRTHYLVKIILAFLHGIDQFSWYLTLGLVSIDF